MTSSNGKIFRVTGHLCQKFPAQKPVTRNIGVLFELCLSKQSQGWWFETPSCPLWHHCYVFYLNLKETCHYKSFSKYTSLDRLVFIYVDSSTGKTTSLYWNDLLYIYMNCLPLTDILHTNKVKCLYMSIYSTSINCIVFSTHYVYEKKIREDYPQTILEMWFSLTK